MGNVRHHQVGEDSSWYRSRDVAKVSYGGRNERRNPSPVVYDKRVGIDTISIKANPWSVLDNSDLSHFAGIETTKNGYDNCAYADYGKNNRENGNPNRSFCGNSSRSIRGVSAII